MSYISSNDNYELILIWLLPLYLLLLNLMLPLLPPASSPFLWLLFYCSIHVIHRKQCQYQITNTFIDIIPNSRYFSSKLFHLIWKLAKENIIQLCWLSNRASNGSGRGDRHRLFHWMGKGVEGEECPIWVTGASNDSQCENQRKFRIDKNCVCIILRSAHLSYIHSIALFCKCSKHFIRQLKNETKSLQSVLCVCVCAVCVYIRIAIVSNNSRNFSMCNLLFSICFCQFEIYLASCY